MGRRNRKLAIGLQRLNHTHSTTYNTTGNLGITASNLGILGVENLTPARPCRPVSVELQLCSAASGLMRYLVLAGNGEEIFASPVIAFGTAPRTHRATLPRSTDFSLYTLQNSIVIYITIMEGSGLHVGFNTIFEYKSPSTVRVGMLGPLPGLSPCGRHVVDDEPTPEPCDS